jgi:hypothetical protein
MKPPFVKGAAAPVAGAPPFGGKESAAEEKAEAKSRGKGRKKVRKAGRGFGRK